MAPPPPARSWANSSTWTSASDRSDVISGRYFDGRSSAAHPAELHIDLDGYMRIVGLSEPLQARIADVTISDRIGNIPRRVTFADGAVFETSDNDAIDNALDALGHRGFLRNVGQWERRWTLAL